MVNESLRALARLHARPKWSAAPSLELGIWQRAEDRTRCCSTAMREHGDGAGPADRVRRQVGRAGAAAGVGSAASTMDGRDYLVINARDVTPDRARAAGARGDPRQRVDRHRVHARPRLRAGQPALRADVRLAGRRAGRAVRSRRLVERRRTTPSSAASSARRSRAASRSRSNGRCGAATAAASCAA